MAPENQFEPTHCQIVLLSFVYDGIVSLASMEIGVAAQDVRAFVPINFGLEFNVEDFAWLDL
jgi:hypothetical protein